VSLLAKESPAGHTEGKKREVFGGVDGQDLKLFREVLSGEGRFGLKGFVGTEGERQGEAREEKEFAELGWTIPFVTMQGTRMVIGRRR